jgi:hypothetical protein
MGLSNIRSRVSSLRGKFSLQSRPGEGMSVRVKVSVSGSDIALYSGSGIYDSEIAESENEKRRKRRNGRKKS